MTTKEKWYVIEGIGDGSGNYEMCWNCFEVAAEHKADCCYAWFCLPCVMGRAGEVAFTESHEPAGDYCPFSPVGFAFCCLGVIDASGNGPITSWLIYRKYFEEQIKQDSDWKYGTIDGEMLSCGPAVMATVHVCLCGLCTCPPVYLRDHTEDIEAQRGMKLADPEEALL